MLVDLSAPGDDLLGPNEAAALRVLARQGRAVTGRDVARLAGTSPSSARRALLRLQRIGLVAAQESSHARLYELQRGHVLWEPVQWILTAPSRVLSAIADVVTGRLGDRATVAVFGSVARGESTADSDVDVALVLHEAVSTGERDAVVDELVDLVQTRSGNTAQVFCIDRAELADMVRSEDPLVRSWLADARTLAGPDLKHLLAELVPSRPATSGAGSAERGGPRVGVR